MWGIIIGVVIGYIFKDEITKQLTKAIRYIKDKRDKESF